VPEHEGRDKGDDDDQSDQIDNVVHCDLSGWPWFRKRFRGSARS